jgi:hypothetical protein
LSTSGGNEQQFTEFRDRLRPGGWGVDSADGRVTISRISAPANS